MKDVSVNSGNWAARIDLKGIGISPVTILNVTRKFN